MMQLDLECLSKDIVSYCNNNDWRGLDRTFNLVECLQIESIGDTKARILLKAIKRLHLSDKALASLCEYIIYNRKLPSVSEILDVTWSNEHGEEQIQHENSNGSVDKNDAKIKGTRLHLLISKYLRGINVQGDFQDLDDLRSSISPIVSKVRKRIYKDFIEKSVIFTINPKQNQAYGPDFGYCGRLDCVAYLENKLCLFEWKTSRAGEIAYDLERYSLQGAAYIWALRETYKIPVEGLVVAVARPNHPAKIFYFWHEQVDTLITKFKGRLRKFSQLKKQLLQTVDCEIRPGITVTNPDKSTFVVSSYSRLSRGGILSYQANNFLPIKSFNCTDDEELISDELDIQDNNFHLEEGELLRLVSPKGNLACPQWPEDEDIYQGGWNVPKDVRRYKLEAQIVNSAPSELTLSETQANKQKGYLKDSHTSTDEFIKDAWIDWIDETDRLAKDYYKAGQYEQAKALYLDSLDKKRFFLDPKHPSIIFNVNDLASVYMALGDFYLSERFLIDALYLRKALFGDNSTPVIQNLIDLAYFYFSLQYYKDAKTAYLEALEGMIKQLGATHPQEIAAVENIDTIQKQIEAQIES